MTAAVSKPTVLNKRTDPVPDGAVYVGRPGPWGNPFRLPKGADDEQRAQCLQEYRAWLHAPEQSELRARARAQLRGKDLVCWCRPKICHGDVLLALANGEAENGQAAS